MNDRERFLATLKFKEIDRPFRWEAPHFWTETMKRWHREGLPEDVTIENIFKYFGMDKLGWIYVEGGWTGTPYCPMFDEVIIEDDGETVVRQEKDGIIKRQKKIAMDSSMPQFLKFPVATREDFETRIRWRLDPKSAERLPPDWDNLKKQYALRDYPLGMFVVGVFGHARNLMGDEVLMYTLYDDPEFIHIMMRHWMEFYLGYIGLVCRDVVPDFLMIWEDMCFVNGPLISPEKFKEFMVPYLKRVIEFAKSKGIEGILVDTDGDFRKLLPIFLEAGINGFYPFEVQSGMDIVALRKEYGKSFLILGGLDKKTLAQGKEAAREEIERKVPWLLSQGGFIPSLDHSCPPDIPLEVFRYYVDYLRTNFGQG